ncbi:S-adenosyl-L-methionine-dependent methyltransferases superfamily protein [Euphorbia peplus]|nr:S-adenosyl-L-methionine-dependent methyltransferases superfamily protein [Euphorbia peplus]
MPIQVQVHHMNGGQGDNSYFVNSLFQKKVILTAKPILEESISEFVSQKNLPDCLTMADFGCSSGPNTLLPLWEIIETIDSTCTKLNKKLPNLQYILNDLPGNDFNTIFRSLVPNFHRRLEKAKGKKFEHCLVGAMPGNFYGRLFPSDSLHFVHSSFSLHWSSQIPEGLVSECGIPLNKGGIFYVTESSPASVRKAYLDRFQKDLTKFLKSRSSEMVCGGHMVITLLAKSVRSELQIIQDSLKEMVHEGMIKESTMDNFNIPFYSPSAGEVKNVIEKENLFKIEGIREFEISWDANIKDGNNESSFNILERGKYVANYMRAVTETMLSSHFGDAIIDDLFRRFSLKVIDYLGKRIGLSKFLVISMKRKVKKNIVLTSGSC